MFVCIYVVIYFRAWYDGCGHENVRIFPGSAPAANCATLSAGACRTPTPSVVLPLHVTDNSLKNFQRNVP